MKAKLTGTYRIKVRAFGITFWSKRGKANDVVDIGALLPSGGTRIAVGPLSFDLRVGKADTEVWVSLTVVLAGIAIHTFRVALDDAAPDIERKVSFGWKGGRFDGVLVVK